MSVGSCGQVDCDGSDGAGEVGGFQFGEGVSVERGRVGGFGGGVVGGRTGVGVGKSSMWWSGRAQSWRRAGTKNGL